MSKATFRADISTLLNRKADAVNSINLVASLLSGTTAIFDMKGAGPGPRLLSDIVKSLPKAFGDPSLQPSDRVKNVVRSYFFIALLTEAEDAVAQSLRLLLQAWPEKLAARQTKAESAKNWFGRRDVVDALVESELNEMFYKKPAEYLQYFSNHFSVPGGMIDGYWPLYIEAKARRDVGLHNAWLANAVYREKTASNVKDGTLMVPDDQYIHDFAKHTTQALRQLATHVETHFANYGKAQRFKDMWEQSSLERVVAFATVWDMTSPDKLSRKQFSWGWSSYETLLFQFFEHVFHENPFPDLPQLLRRASTDDRRLVMEWIDYPFYF